jgi:hypothetical protein
LKLIAHSARPEKLRSSTQEILSMLGIDPLIFAKLIFSGARGHAKREALSATLSEIGASASRTVVVDDLDDNLAGARSLGAVTAKLDLEDPNYARFDSYQFLKLAKAAASEDERVEYLLNAAAVSRNDAEASNAEGIASKLLAGASLALFMHEVKGLREMVQARDRRLVPEGR